MQPLPVTQRSLVKASPSSQLKSVCLQLPATDGSQLSAVQGSPSSQDIAVPVWHTPAPLHVSDPLHGLLSAHDVPAARPGWHVPSLGSQLSHPPSGRMSHKSEVQAFPSSH